MSDDSANIHPSPEAITDFINGRLSPSARATLDYHFAECRSCRQQVVSARRLLDTYQARRPLRWAIPALAALVLLTLGPRFLTRAPTSEALRGNNTSPADGPRHLAVVAPANGDTIVSAPLTFVWHSQTGRPLFRLTLNDGARELWSMSTSDTIATLPDSVSLRPGQSYSWYVDALGSDGRTLVSGTQQFRIKR